MIEDIQILRENIKRVFIGKDEVVDVVLVGLFSGGHILIEDVPGVGKTILARTLARSIHCSFRRIQFTPDLLPTDIIGVSIFNAPRDEFVFKKGPIFANIILADEINRTTPRTQSSLLEAMNDYHVSVDGVSHPLPSPFMVIATQNPFEFTGTFSLPESQLDRFLLRLRIGYPGWDDEKRVLYDQKIRHPFDSLLAVMSSDQVLEIQQRVREVNVDETIADYILAIAEGTRNSDELEIGVSPRGNLNLFRAAQALALIEGRNYCVPDDVKRLAVPVLAHRVVDKISRGTGPGAEAIRIVTAIRDQVTAKMAWA
ncbi:MAG: hypothetical protein AMS15_00600 [Planctomycetes bacterium DG_23]|nr:MAG: hypothetical protein AMS15_00600 [Planctomycetes bacterium DG_23]